MHAQFTFYEWYFILESWHDRKYHFKILGFGKQGTKTYGISRDKPDYWPDCLSWETFQHPSYTKGNDVNIILESIFRHFNIDISEHHKSNGAVEPLKKKKKVTSKPTVDNDETIIEEEEEYLNSSQFSANEDSNEVEDSNEAVFPPETEPCDYERLRNDNIAEREAAYAAAEANGEV